MPQDSGFVSVEWRMGNTSPQAEKRAHLMENIVGSDLVMIVRKFEKEMTSFVQLLTGASVGHQWNRKARLLLGSVASLGRSLHARRRENCGCRYIVKIQTRPSSREIKKREAATK